MNNTYKIVYIDLNKERVFVSYRPLTPKTEYEKQQMKEAHKAVVDNFQQAGESFANYELVDITDWEYDSFDELQGKMFRYDPSEVHRKQ